MTTILGIRHHGPGSARSVAAELERLRPDAVLIEGPADASDLIPLAGDPAMRPPVALLVYAPDEPRMATFYPLAAFSPEWVALRWALANGVPVLFIDLAAGVQLAVAKEAFERAAADATAQAPDHPDHPDATDSGNAARAGRHGQWERRRRAGRHGG